MSLPKKFALFLGDILLLYAALAGALLIRYGVGEFGASFDTHVGPFSKLFLLWLIILYIADLYRPAALRSRAAIWRSLLRVVAIAVVASTVVFYLFGSEFSLTPKTNLLIFGALFLALDGLWRTTVRSRFAAGAANLIVVGTSPLTAAIIQHLRENPQTGYRVVDWLERPDAAALQTLPTRIAEHRAGMVVFERRTLLNPDALAAAYRLLPREVALLTSTDIYETTFERVPLAEIDETWFIRNITTRRRFYDALKRALDLAASAILLVILSPLLLLIALMVAATSRGPVIFRQSRIGKLGRPFTLYKFRIMVKNHDGSPVTLTNDPRFTRAGKFLNFTHLNELPQLWNVLRGDLSLTGPRPESAELVTEYASLPYYNVRHVVKPGVTGWAQINFKPSTSREEAFEKLSYDIYYIAHRSLLLDLLIIFRTVKHLVAPAR